MKEVMISLMGSRLLLLASAFMLSWSSLQTLLKLSDEKKGGNVPIFIFSLINSLCLVAWDKFFPLPRPVAMMIIPTIIILELCLISRDDWWAYLNFFFLFLLDGFSFYGICSAIITILLNNPWTIGSDGHRRVLLTITFFFTALIFWAVPRSRAITVEELADLLHSRKKGRLLFVYITTTSLVLLISAMFILNLIYDEALSRYAQIMINADLALKNSLILIGSFLIILFHIWEERKSRQMVEIDSDLKMERQFRENSQEDAILRFCLDVSLGEIVEGQWAFQILTTEFAQDTVRVLGDFRMNCIHKKDRHHFIPLEEVDKYRQKLATTPFYTFNARMSVNYLLSKMYLPKEVQDKLRNMQKEWIWTRVQIVVVGDEESGDMLCYLSFTDIDQEVTFSENLLREATKDALTGVYNRATMESSLTEMLQTEKVSRAFFMIDMDHFKSINDTLGHPEGDEALKETAKILQGVFRKKDMVFRMGGDEFCVFAPNFTNVDMVCKRAEELNKRGRITRLSQDGKKAVHTSFSIGIVICKGEQTLSYEELYHRADLALYEAKGAGRDTFRLYSTALEE